MKKKLITLRKLIFGFGFVFTLFRITRYVTLRYGVPFRSLAISGSDNWIYLFPMGFIVSMYSFLLLFWTNICSKSKHLAVSGGWFGGMKIRMLLLTTNILVYIFLTLTAILETVTDGESRNYTNGVIALICLIFSISFIVQGTRVFRTIKGMNHAKKEKNLLLWRFSMITIVASTTFLLTIILIILWGVTEVILENSPDSQFLSCQTFQLSFRIIETILILVITYPFHFQQKRRSSKPDDSELSSNSKTTESTTDSSSMTSK